MPQLSSKVPSALIFDSSLRLSLAGGGAFNAIGSTHPRGLHCTCAWLFVTGSLGQQRPKHILQITMDQLRDDLLRDYVPTLSQGFGRLESGGFRASVDFSDDANFRILGHPASVEADRKFLLSKILGECQFVSLLRTSSEKVNDRGATNTRSTHVYEKENASRPVDPQSLPAWFEYAGSAETASAGCPTWK
jgi:hypothetical protein